MIIRRTASTNWATLLILMVMVAFGNTHMTVAPFLNEMARDLGVSKGVAGQLGTMTFLAMALSAVSVVPFIQRLSLRPVLTLGMVGLAAASVSTGLVSWFPGLLLIRFAAGIAAGLVYAGCMAALGRAWTDPTARAKRQGFVIAATAGGPGLIAPALRLVAGGSSWQTALIAAGAFTGIVAVVGWLMLPEMPGDRGSAVLPLRERLLVATRVPRMPVIGPTLLLRAMGMASVSCVFAYIAGFTVEQYLNADDWIGPVFAGGPAGFALGAVLSGVLIPRLGGPTLATTLGVVVQLGVVSLFVWVTPSPAVTLSIFLVWGVLCGLYFNALVSLLYEYSGSEQSAVMFVDSAGCQFGSTVGVAVGGVAVAAMTGFVGWQLVLIAICALNLPLMMIARHSAHRQAALAAGG